MANSFVGTWNATWTGGSHTGGQMTITDTGGGSYPNGGTLLGEFGDGSLSYSGTWTDESNASGTFTFVLVGTDTFIGVWGFSNGSPGGQWNGTADR